jgi:adenine-specific DNA-methyltransferase
MDKLKMHSPNLTDENVAKIRDLFPGCVTEAADEAGKRRLVVDFDQLRQELSDHVVEGPQERYRLDWPGKREALAVANAPITKTLRPVRESSIDFEHTNNLFIEGDNLDALKLLQETYLGKIKLVYIDPPYNTGNDFIYRDVFSSNQVEHEIAAGERSEEGNRLVANPDTSGRFHSDWLTMLYPRLKMARNLLSEDGIIVIHIDEHEYANLEKILDEIFGPENNLGTVIWDKRNPKGDAKGIAQQHELIAFYARNSTYVKNSHGLKRKKENADAILKQAEKLISASGGVSDQVRRDFKSWLSHQTFSGGELAYSHIDENGHVFQPVSMAWPNNKPAPADYFETLMHPVTGKACPIPEKGWRNPSATMKALLSKGLIVFGPDETTQPRRKYLLSENMSENVSSLLYFGGSDDEFFKSVDLFFDNPKPIYVAKKLIEACCPAEGTVLDFFAGSSTCAHATLAINSEDGVNRKFIMVQLAEEIPDGNPMRKKGFEHIPQLSAERIRRAGAKIIERPRHPSWNADVGFRVLKVDTSNMQDVFYRPDEVGQADLLAAVDNIKPDRTPEDLLFQVLVDWGVDLTLPIRRETIHGKTVFFVDDNALAACFDSGVTEELVKELAGHMPLRMVFRDNGFVSDAVKINVEQIFRQLSPNTDIKSI